MSCRLTGRLALDSKGKGRRQVKQPGTSGRTRKHASKAKHQPRAKHNPRAQPPPATRSGRASGGGSGGPVRTVASPPKPAKPRKLSPGADVACCSAQALGTLLGWPPEGVLDLYWRTCQTADEGATIEDTLRAAEGPGRPAWHVAQGFAGPGLAAGKPRGRGALILGVELPGPHALAVTPDGTWWSWGRPFNPAEWPELIIEEAWAVTL